MAAMRAKPTEVDLSAEPPVGLNVCDPLCPRLAGSSPSISLIFGYLNGRFWPKAATRLELY